MLDRKPDSLSAIACCLASALGQDRHADAESHEGDNRQGCHGNRGPVSPDELGRTVAQRGSFGSHGIAIQIGGDVVAEFARRPVPLPGFLAHRHQDDVVQLSIHLCCPRLAPCGFCGAGARCFRIAFADCAIQFHRSHGCEAEGTRSRKQFIKHDAQRINVSCGGHGRAGDLLGTGIFRGH